MGKYIDFDVPDDTIGIQALRRIKAEGPKRQSLGIVMEAGEKMQPGFSWNPVLKNGQKVGDLTIFIYSYRLQANIGFVLVLVICQIGALEQTVVGGKTYAGRLTELPFL